MEKNLEKTYGAVENIGQLLGIPTPVRIEAFDNSNIMGTSPVSAMVVFENGVPNKRNTASIRLRRWRGQMTMLSCVKFCSGGTVGCCGTV